MDYAEKIPDAFEASPVSVSDRQPVAPPGVSDQLRTMLEQRVEPQVEKTAVSIDSEGVPDAEDAEIHTVDQYLEVELDSRLEKYYLALRFENLHSATHPVEAGTLVGENARTARSQQYRAVVNDRPHWEEHFPKDESPEELQKWEAFLEEYPDDMQLSLRNLHTNETLLGRARENEQLKREVETKHAKEREIKQAGILLNAIGRMIECIQGESDRLTQRVAEYGQPLTAGQQRALARNATDMANFTEMRKRALDALPSVEAVDAAKRHAASLSLLRDRADYRRGLIETSVMKDISDRHMASLATGGKLMLVGETGGAKTALAKNIAKKVLALHGKKDLGYEFVSAYGDINAYQLIGKSEMRVQDGASVTEFALGAISRAMAQGRPLIIDEINAMPAEIAKRLNEILQLPIGAEYSLQENGGQRIRIKEGFCVIATANDNTERYKGVQQMSPELKNRFVGSTERVQYPDADILPGQLPAEQFRVMNAALADRTGNIPFERYGFTPHEYIRLLKAAHTTQRLFCEPATTAFTTYLTGADDTRIAEGRPGLDKEVLSPRAVGAMLEKIRDSAGAIQLGDVLRAFVDSIDPNSSDRRVIEKVLTEYELI